MVSEIKGVVIFLVGDEKGHRDSGVLAVHVQLYDVERTDDIGLFNW